MSHPPTACDRELLRQSLDDKLSEGQEEQLARHLAECAECRHDLEQLAGGQDEWSKVSAALKWEAESAQSLDPSRQDRFAAHHDDAAESAADFAVDFLEPSTAADSLGRLGDINILATIGRGGMGVVLKGFQPELQRLVAVKVLAPHLATSGPARQRFAREARAAAAILHPNVMPILTVNSTGKLPFLVMPYIACESLQQRIARDGPLELVDILRIGTQTAGGLAAAHAQGLVHRDVKPANILLEKGVDRVMLTDFGLARAVDDASITRTGIIAGTPQFMSPEQARGEPVDARSDLFSLGSVLYAMCTGRPPFRAESTFGILRRITDDTPRPVREINSAIPVWLAAIIHKLLAKEPRDRFPSADSAAALLEQCLAHLQEPTATPLPEFCRSRRRPTRRQLFVAGGLATAGLVAIVLAIVQGPPQANQKSPPLGDQGHANSVVAASSSSDERATGWDAAAEDLNQLDREALPFESRVDRLWDRVPVSISDDSNPNNPSDRSELESNP
jgi:eukaryotic-like serine/threonine-protein kinase